MHFMANMHSKKLRGLRQIDDDLWDDLGTAATAAGSDRSAVSKQFYEWFVRRPGAALPTRPASPPDPPPSPAEPDGP
jgi:hypothetical protein